MRPPHRSRLAILALLAMPVAAKQDVSLVDMSLDDLLNVTVTTASRREQNLFGTSASVHVVSAEDIRRSGARTVPDLLRRIPGVQVAQINEHQWAISVRGFNRVYANKLLVLVDGRSVYSPVAAGVDWDSVNVVPEDIERIEIVRGPGGAIWGANAVNGVINIITKRASDTQGDLLTTGFGTDRRSEVAYRHGGELGAGAHWRAGIRLTSSPGRPEAPEDGGPDAWSDGRVGFRYDRELASGDLMVGLDASQGTGDEIVTTVLPRPPFSSKLTGSSTSLEASAIARWTRRGPRNEVALQLYHEHVERSNSGLWHHTKTTDFDVRVATTAGRHALVWGGGLRVIYDRSGSRGSFRLADPFETVRVPSAFVHDDITLPVPGLHLVVGTKFEHREALAGLQVQPDIRLIWSNERHAAWAAVSRATRTPSRVEETLVGDVAAFPMGRAIGVVRVLGSRDLRAEQVTSREVGYRFQSPGRFSVDLSLFDSDFQDLVTALPGTPGPGSIGTTPVVVIPIDLDNGLAARVRGGEVLVRWHPARWCELQAGASRISFDLRAEKPGVDTSTSSFVDATTPSSQYSLRAHFRLSEALALDASWERVGRLPEGVAARDDVSVGLDWRIGARGTLRVQGDNLFVARHSEFAAAEGLPLTQTEPAGRILFGWTF